MWTRRKKYLRHVAEVLEAILFFHFICRVDVSSCKVSYLAKHDVPVYAKSALSSYPQLFDWLNLIDFNVLFILVL